jgi:LysR family glycine cleavage system transcriptional activator
MALQKLPPLGSLEAFVAVAQRQSLKAAAPELNISVSALSRRIQTLEGHLGLILFERGAREFRLTEDGSALLESVCASLDMLWDSISSLGPSQKRSALRVGTPAGFASYWLAPRIAAFKAAQPLLDVSIDTENLTLGRLGGGLHAMVVIGDEGELRSNERYRIERLAPLRVRAVCSPSLLVALGGEMRADDLEGQTVLSTRNHADWFACWRREIGASPRPHRLEYFDSTPVMLEAAANGLGVAISPDLVVQPHLASGRLVDPFDTSAATRSGYYFAVRETDADLALVSRFHAWLHREMTQGTAEGD